MYVEDRQIMDSSASIRRTFVLCVLSCVFLGVLCTENQAQNVSQPITSDSGNKDDQTSIEQGMQVLFDMTNAFLDIVQSEELFKQPWLNLTEIYKDPAKAKDIVTKWQNMLNYGRGYTACIVAGLIFFIFMPIFGLFFCCCRCCGKCGGKKTKMDPPHVKCKRVSFCAVLLIFNTIMLAGVVCCFVSNDLIHSRLMNTDNKGPVGGVSSAFRKIDEFVDDVVQDVANKALKTFDDTRTVLVNKINESANNAVEEVAKSLDVTKLLGEAKQLADDVTKTQTDLNNVNTYLKNLAAMGENLTMELNEIKEAVNSSCSAPCNISTTNYNTDANFTQLSDLASLTGNITEALNMSLFVKEAEDSIKDIKKNVTNIINDQINSASSKLDTIREGIDKKIKTFKNQVNVSTLFIKNVQDTLNTTSSEVKRYADYVYYGGIGVCCVYLLIVVLYYLGVLYGMCGERPGDDAPCCNKGMGGNFLMAGVGFSFLFSWLLILLIIILFITGGLFYTEMCRYFVNHDPDSLQPFQDVLKAVDLPQKLFNNSNIDINIVDILNDCKANKPVYPTLKLENVFNISSAINTEELLSEFDKLANKTITFGNISILPDGLKTEIDKFANSGLDNINFTEYEQQMSKELVVVNLTLLAKVLFDQSNSANESNKPDLAKTLRENGERLKELETKYVIKMKDEVSNLNTSLNSLKEQMDIKNKTKNLVDGLKEAEDNFNKDGVKNVTGELKHQIEELKKFTQDKIDDLITNIKHAGKCKPLYDSFYMMTDAVCISFLNPLNGFWFSMGWCIFFFIPSIIFAVLLTGLYRREEEYDETKEFDDPNYPGYGGSQPDTIPLTRVNQQQGHEPGYSNSGYHRDDHHYSSNGAYNNGYPAYGDGNPRPDYPGSKEPLPPAYGGGPQVYPSDHGFHGKPPKYSY